MYLQMPQFNELGLLSFKDYLRHCYGKELNNVMGNKYIMMISWLRSRDYQIQQNSVQIIIDSMK
jgi:hypothetical protein